MRQLLRKTLSNASRRTLVLVPTIAFGSALTYSVIYSKNPVPLCKLNMPADRPALEYGVEIPLKFSKDWPKTDGYLQKMEQWTRGLQKKLVTELEALEFAEPGGVAFKPDEHQNGVAMVLQDGRVFEKAGVNVTAMHSILSEGQARHMLDKADLAPLISKLNDRTPFYVVGISVVLHPRNPHCPTLHFNYRYFELELKSGERTWWFGGGTDLTPMYVNEQEATEFHRVFKAACDAVDKSAYPKYKKEADNYFVVKHRGERRGVGGIFFDSKTGDKQECFRFVDSCGNAFTKAYIPIMLKNMNRRFTEQEARFQQLRHGRYVEFNVMYDRGTKFGLDRPEKIHIERVLMSLPLHCRYEYRYEPPVGSPEEATLRILREDPPRDWVPLQ